MKTALEHAEYCFNPSQLFRKTVNRFYNRPAIAFDEKVSLTYAELDTLSDKAVRFLLSRGVSRSQPIGICLEKSASFYILLLAALKMGVPYFAMDPRNPVHRLKSILDQCGPSIVFSHDPFSTCLDPQQTINCPLEHELPEFLMHFDSGAVADLPPVPGSNPAYIMFTSGSTGAPKGVVISNDNLYHFINWCCYQYGFTHDDIHTHLNPVYFDNSVFDIFSTFFTGGTLVPFTHEVLMSPLQMAKRLRDMKCTVWFSVPSLLIFCQNMRVMKPEFFGNLRRIIFGGEGFPKAKLKKLIDVLGPEIEYHNVSGPTECTCICSSYQVTDMDMADLTGLPPLGELIPNFYGLILDGDSEVSPGQTGELCLGGPCVGLGYFSQTGLTERSFVQNPLNNKYREIIYRTGDLVRRDVANGKLYFVGRKDFQIKHMGFRIELEEIEQALNRCNGVSEAAVIYNPDRGQGEIVALVAVNSSIQLKELTLELSSYIPKYMMPAKTLFLDSLPKNANGKIDKRRLAQEYGG